MYNDNIILVSSLLNNQNRQQTAPDNRYSDKTENNGLFDITSIVVGGGRATGRLLMIIHVLMMLVNSV